MEKEYLLFLDESKPNGGSINHLCLAGVIIEKEKYEKIVVSAVGSLKQEVFGNSQIILHETAIRSAKEPYTEMRKEEKRTLFWKRLAEIFSAEEIIAIGAAVNVSDYNNLYANTYVNDEYYIALQIILENFVHFLEAKNAVGSIYIESRNSSEDKKLKNIYHKIIANGTLFLNQFAYQDKLLNLNFLIKADNNIGLQLADFVPGALNRECNALPPKEPNILDEIKGSLYDGNCKLCSRFGFKIMP